MVLLQVLRYSQSYSALSIDTLSSIYERFTGDTTHLAVAFCEWFGYTYPSAVQEWGEKIGRRHHLVVVTDGANDETIAALGHGLDIEIWPYRVYPGEGKSFRLELPELYRSKGTAGQLVCSGDFSREQQPDAQCGYRAVHARSWRCASHGAEVDAKNQPITAGSRVVLYGNGVGILAFGIATPERRDADLNGVPMRFVK